MVRLPDIPIEKTALRAPQTQVSGRAVRSAYTNLAQGLDEIGAQVEQAAIEEATLQGQNAVARDEDGNLTVDTRLPFTGADRAFNRAARTSLLAQVSGDIRTGVADLRREANGDVEAFQQSFDAFRKQLLSGQDPLMEGPVGQLLDAEFGAARNGLIDRQRAKDVKAFEGRIDAEIKSLDDELAALAHAGGTNTDDYVERLDSVRALYAELVANPEFALTQEEADIAIDRMASRHKGEAVVGRAETLFKEKGFDAAKEEIDRILRDPDLGLSPAERRQYTGLALGRIDGIGAQRKALLAETRINAASLTEALKNRQDVDDGDVDQVLSQLSALGDMRTFFKLSRERTISRQLAPFKQLNDRAQADDLQRIQGGTPGSLVNRIVTAESSGRLEARNPRSTATGPGQFIESTWLNLVRKHRPDLSQGRTDEDLLALRTNDGLSRQMTLRLAEENTATLERANVPVSDTTLYLAHFLGPGADTGAVAVLKADPSTPIADIVGEKVMTANPHLKGLTAGSVIQLAAKRIGDPDTSRPDRLPTGVWTVKDNGLEFYKSSELIGRAGDGNAWADATTVFLADQVGKTFFDATGKRVPATAVTTQGKDGTERSLQFNLSGLDRNGRASFLATALQAGFTGVGFDGDGKVLLSTGKPDVRGDVPSWATQVMDTAFDPGGSPVNGLRSPGIADPRAIKEMKAEVTADAKRLFAQMKDGVSKTALPSRGDLALLTDQLALIDDENFRAEVVDFLEDTGALEQFAGLPTASAEQDLSRTASQAAQGLLAADDFDLFKMKSDMHKRTVKMLETDPIGLGVERRVIGVPEPLNFSDEASLVESLAIRQDMVRKLEQHYGRTNIPAVQAEEADALAQTLNTADANQKAFILSSMATGLDGDTYRATIGKVVGKTSGPTVIAGVLFETNPTVAQSVLRGGQLLRAEKRLTWKEDDTSVGIVDRLFPAGALAPDMIGARSQMMTAVRARYADLSAEAGDTSQIQNGPRLEQSIREITGGILEHNGEPVMAPRPGMLQGDFERLLDGLTDRDVAGAQSFAGHGITADDIRDRARLRAVGDGRYLLQFGDDDAASYALDGNDKPFILDLRRGG